MRVSPLLTLPLLLALAACKPATAPVAVDTPAPAAPAAAPPAEPAACPDADFAAFLRRFEGNADVQRTASADPLTMDSIDPDAQPEPAPMTRQVPLSEVTFPLMPSRAQREADGLQETVSEPSATERVVRHAMPDSGVQVRYTFQAAPCWTLARVSDDTI